VHYRHGEGCLLTRDKAFIRLLGRMRASAHCNLPVLLTGESGTGKDVVSRLLHRWSGREGMRYVPVNVAALPGSLFESALFGHSRGAFTGAEARRRGLLEEAGEGTVYLDEIGELPLELQAKLLRLLEGGEYRPLGEVARRYNRARVVAATNIDLEGAIASGRFRRDLYHRLAVLRFEIPPLRARRVDIMPLADHFLAQASLRFGLGKLTFSEGAREALCAYGWPGNVRELLNEVLGAAVRKRRGVIRASTFSPALASPAGGSCTDRAQTLDGMLRAFERREILTALHDSGGNRTEAAGRLGLSRTTLIYRMKRLGIE
jgi:DNA-binding NtrC family response regulator